MSKTTIRYRFVFNRRQKTGGIVQGGSRGGSENFSRVIIRDVAFRVADDDLKKIVSQLQSRIRLDVLRELQWTATLFMKNIIGVGGRMRGPSGVMSMKAEPHPSVGQTYMSTRSLTGEWPARSPKYLASRKGNAWFRDKGRVLSALKNADTWTSAFGPISVGVKAHTRGVGAKRAKGMSTVPTGTKYAGERVRLATIRVDALTRITPAMLPALAGGSLASSGLRARKDGLLSMLGPDIAYRLGGNPKYVPYRPTIQPFLAYFLTRSMPSAVLGRLEQGLKGKYLNDGRGSRGRASSRSTF